MPDHSKMNVTDPSQTLPVPITAEEFWKRTREDAVSRALVSQDKDEWSREPPSTGDRDWDSDRGCWSDLVAEVPDPSFVDADEPRPTSLHEGGFDWPEDVQGALPQTEQAQGRQAWRPVLPVPPRPTAPSRQPSEIAAQVAVACLAVVLGAWWMTT